MSLPTSFCVAFIFRTSTSPEPIPVIMLKFSASKDVFYMANRNCVWTNCFNTKFTINIMLLRIKNSCYYFINFKYVLCNLCSHYVNTIIASYCNKYVCLLCASLFKISSSIPVPVIRDSVRF